jgi:hypothetical protein
MDVERMSGLLTVLSEAGPGEYPEARRELTEALRAVPAYASRKRDLMAAKPTMTDEDADELLAQIEVDAADEQERYERIMR